MAYTARIVDRTLDALMPGLPAIALEGPKAVGKSATAARRSARVIDLGDPSALALVGADLDELDAGSGTVLIDEWQRYPPVWDRVRRLVDAGAPAGRFLLAGSAVPVGAPVHSGAGRIVSLRMRPLSLAERRLVDPTVSVAALLSGERSSVDGSSDIGLETYVEEIVASGFPAIRGLSTVSHRRRLTSYIERISDRDFEDQGRAVRRPESLRAWMTAYGAATATTTSYSSLLDAATPGIPDKPARTTTQAHRDTLAALWVLDPVPGWVPGRNRLDRLTQSPKHHLADPALAASLLGVDVDALLLRRSGLPAAVKDGSLLGRLFESLVTLSVRVYAEAAEARVLHLRQSSGRHEVDLIIERADGCVVAIEVKLGATVDDRDVQHLRWLGDELGRDLLDAVVITTGRYAYRRPDGVAVLPAALLGP